MTPRSAILALACCAALSAARAASGAEPQYVGSRLCRTCHASTDQNRFHLFTLSAHAKAFDVLQGAEKTDPKCLGCHTTGYGGAMADQTTEKDLRGVQCEACHGPGSNYKGMKVMKDPKLARQNGLWEPTRDVCMKCHR